MKYSDRNFPLPHISCHTCHTFEDFNVVSGFAPKPHLATSLPQACHSLPQSPEVMTHVP
jgi:hypothetical protein